MPIHIWRIAADSWGIATIGRSRASTTMPHSRSPCAGAREHKSPDNHTSFSHPNNVHGNNCLRHPDPRLFPAAASTKPGLMDQEATRTMGSPQVLKWSTKHSNKAARVRENQRRHREKVRNYIAHLESRLARAKLSSIRRS